MYILQILRFEKMGVEEIENLLKERIKEVCNGKRYGFSLCGPQKDDFLFVLNGHEAKSTASQGEKNP